MQNKPRPIPHVHGRNYSAYHCFYCGTKLRTRTAEHVFPLWLQKRFALQDQHLTLLNRTTIKYSQLKIPCCGKCNNEHLSRLETRVKRYLGTAPSKLTRQHLSHIFTWVSKILLGIVYKERLLPGDRRRPDGGPILPEQFRHAFDLTHLLAQNVRIPIDFTAEGSKRTPGSIFVFRLKSQDDLRAQFDFRDDLPTLSIYLRLGDRGIIAVADGGALDFEIGDLFRKDSRRVLHPLQFEELGAIAFYKASLLNRTPKYLIFKKRERLQIFQMPLAGLSSKPVFDPWVHSSYAGYLSAFTGYPIDLIAPGDRSKVMQWRVDKEGNPLNIPL